MDDTPTAQHHPTAQSYPCLDGVARPFRSGLYEPTDFDIRVGGVIEHGFGHASGQNPRSPYPGGTLGRQYPLFKQQGLDLGTCYPGTLNVSIAPRTFRLQDPPYVFTDIVWYPGRKGENFSFCHCILIAGGLQVAGYVYYPDPATKTRHYDNPSHLQIIAPYLPGLGYGSWVELALNSAEIMIEG